MSMKPDWPSHDELEKWARMPLAQLQDAERRIYGRPLSTARMMQDNAYYKKGQKLNRPTKADVAQLLENAPAFPAGQPDPRWESDQLDDFITHSDAQIAAQPAAAPPLRWEDLSNKQLDDMTAGQQSQAPKRRTVKVRRS
jgi:hypothetical protein